MCKGKKQTNTHKKMQSNTHSHSSTLPFLPCIPLPLPGIIFFSLSDSVLFCIHKPIQRGLFSLYVVDVMERASTPDYSSNWDWNQLFLNTSVLYYIKVLISCYNILHREIFSILLSCCCSRSRSFIQYLRFGTGLQFWHDPWLKIPDFGFG